jgi:hypothetical protein
MTTSDLYPFGRHWPQFPSHLLPRTPEALGAARFKYYHNPAWMLAAMARSAGNRETKGDRKVAFWFRRTGEMNDSRRESLWQNQ